MPTESTDARDAVLLDLQKQIAIAKGYTRLEVGVDGRLSGVLHVDEGLTIVPRWPWDMADAWQLVEEMEEDGCRWDAGLYAQPEPGARYWFTFGGPGEALADDYEADLLATAISNCWLAWKDV